MLSGGACGFDGSDDGQIPPDCIFIDAFLTISVSRISQLPLKKPGNTNRDSELVETFSQAPKSRKPPRDESHGGLAGGVSLSNCYAGSLNLHQDSGYSNSPEH